MFFFFFKQKTAYEMRISDWSSDVCSSDLRLHQRVVVDGLVGAQEDALLLVVARGPVECRAEGVLRDRRIAERPGVVGLDRQEYLQIGRASCRERVCQYVVISVVAVPLEKTKKREREVSNTRQIKLQ